MAAVSVRRRGRRWDNLALKIRERDDYTCQECGEWGNECDHIVPLRAGGAMWDESNLQILCSTCHVRKTRREHGKMTESHEEWYDEWLRLLGKSDRVVESES